MRLKSLAIKVPRLGINRYGTYYVRTSVRTSVSGSRKVVQRSLGTKDPNLAKILALKFCLELVQEDALSAINKNIANYELDVRQGIAKADGADDHARMLEAMKAMADLQALQTQIFSQQASVAALVPTTPAFFGAGTLPAAAVSDELTQVIRHGCSTQARQCGYEAQGCFRQASKRRGAHPQGGPRSWRKRHCSVISQSTLVMSI